MLPSIDSCASCAYCEVYLSGKAYCPVAEFPKRLNDHCFNYERY